MDNGKKYVKKKLHKFTLLNDLIVNEAYMENAKRNLCGQDGRIIFVACAAASPALGVCLRPLILRASSREKPEISGAAYAENCPCLSA